MKLFQVKEHCNHVTSVMSSLNYEGMSLYGFLQASSEMLPIHI